MWKRGAAWLAAVRSASWYFSASFCWPHKTCSFVSVSSALSRELGGLRTSLSLGGRRVRSCSLDRGRQWSVHFCNFVISRMSCKWNHTACDLWGLAFFTQPNSPKFLPLLRASAVCSALWQSRCRVCGPCRAAPGRDAPWLANQPLDEGAASCFWQLQIKSQPAVRA